MLVLLFNMNVPGVRLLLQVSLPFGISEKSNDIFWLTFRQYNPKIYVNFKYCSFYFY